MARTNLPARRSTGGQTPRVSRMSTPSTEPILYNPLPLVCSQCRELQSSHARQNSSLVSTIVNSHHNEIPKLDNEPSTISPSLNDALLPAPKPKPTSTSTSTFHSFPFLPLEIQTQIWKHAAEISISTPRIIPILVHWTPRRPSKTHPGKPPITISPIPTTPPLLHTSSLSRKLTLPHYTLAGSGTASYHSNYDIPIDQDDDSRKIFYINPEIDILYFTSHKVFDAEGNQHWPSRYIDCENNDRSSVNYRCVPCTNVQFSITRALRVIVANLDVRLRLKNVVVSLDVSGLHRDNFWGNGCAFEDLKGITEFSCALVEDDYLSYGVVCGEGERMIGLETAAGTGEDREKMEISEFDDYQNAIFNGITKADLNNDLRIWKLTELVLYDFAVRKRLEGYKGFKENLFNFYCFVSSGTGNADEEQTIEQRDVGFVVVENVKY